MFLFRSSECTKLVDMDLVTLEEIRQVKYRYLRCVDQKLWDELADVFTSDATVDYGTRVYGQPLKITGRDEIIAFFRAKLGPDVITVHAAGQPEITVDGDTATGTWRFEDTVIATEHRIVVAGAAYYEDRYERGADGMWRIAHTGYVRTYEAMMSLDDLPSFRLTAGPSSAADTAADAAAGSGTNDAGAGASVADAAVR
jgi:SnoaL-like domain